MFQELKLNMLLAESLPLLAQLLHQLSCDLRLQDYMLHYWKDFPLCCPLVTCTSVSTANMKLTDPLQVIVCNLYFEIELPDGSY